MRPRIVVTTCGISLLTNADPGRRNWLYRWANAQERDLPPAEREAALDLARHAREALAAADIRRARELSAELNVILGLYGPHWPAGARADTHYLLHTDTVLGRLAAEVLAGWLKERGVAAAPCKVDALTVRNTDELQWGVSELVAWCEEHIEPCRGQCHVVFNLTGGFKAVQGVLNTLGMFYADELVYTFEGTSELVRIPRLPVRLEAEETVRQHLAAFRRMSLGVQVSPAEAAGIPESLVMASGGGMELSGWGRLVWERTWRGLYQERLLDPPVPVIRYGPQFPASVAPYAGTGRMAQINQRIDDLAQYLLTGQSRRRLDPKPVRSGAMAPATHEIDAWHDGDARRIYFHYQGSVAVLDRLDRALH